MWLSRECGDIWRYGVSVEQAPSGKPFSIVSYLIASDGTVLSEFYGEITSCNQDGLKTFLRVKPKEPGGEPVEYVYEPGSSRLQ